MAQVMQVIMRFFREKGVVDDAGSMNIVARVQEVTEGIVYPSASLALPEMGIPHCQSHH